MPTDPELPQPTILLRLDISLDVKLIRFLFASVTVYQLYLLYSAADLSTLLVVIGSMVIGYPFVRRLCIRPLADPLDHPGHFIPLQELSYEGDGEDYSVSKPPARVRLSDVSKLVADSALPLEANKPAAPAPPTDPEDDCLTHLSNHQLIDEPTLPEPAPLLFEVDQPVDAESPPLENEYRTNAPWPAPPLGDCDQNATPTTSTFPLFDEDKAYPLSLPPDEGRPSVLEEIVDCCEGDLDGFCICSL